MNNPFDELGTRTAEAVDHPTGPDVGERLHDITFPDQTGTLVNIEAARGEGRALVEIDLAEGLHLYAAPVPEGVCRYDGDGDGAGFR
ncbi:MAG: hypothetical protein QF664_07120 [Dehalococcoidia bacterium]|nr:hypothetical protein [Dehalococcoidia bacterium]